MCIEVAADDGTRALLVSSFAVRQKRHATRQIARRPRQDPLQRRHDLRPTHGLGAIDRLGAADPQSRAPGRAPERRPVHQWL